MAAEVTGLFLKKQKCLSSLKKKKATEVNFMHQLKVTQVILLN